MDENGKLKPFRQWKEEVTGIASHFVGPWLQTEYNTAVIRAHNAADWLNFERNKDIFPNLRWMPTMSPDPDEVHRVFWERKVTRPINDPFWNKHRPGDRWNCKCTLEATDDPITDIPGETDKERPQPGLKENPAKTKQIFDKSHPYFPKSCDKCKFNKGFKSKLTGLFENVNKDCNKCILKATKKITPQEKHEIYQKPIEEQFVKVSGNIKRHILKFKNTDDYKEIEIVARTLSPYVKEVQIMTEIHKSEVDVRKRLGIKSEKKNPDLRLILHDGNIEWIDVKSPLTPQTIVRNANDACKQEADACVTEVHIKNIDHANIARKIFNDSNYTRPYVYIQYNNSLYKYNSQGLVEVLD